MAVYPPEITRRMLLHPNVGDPGSPDARGRAVNFDCASQVTFELCVSVSTVTRVRFVSNGCGYMIAAASALSISTEGRDLAELHGLNADALLGLVEGLTVSFPGERKGCLLAAIEALRSAFAELRRRRVDEFSAAEALICSCFGVTEIDIENCISANAPGSVEAVTDLCRAGGGCGSCRMLIQEILDAAARGADML